MKKIIFLAFVQLAVITASGQKAQITVLDQTTSQPVANAQIIDRTNNRTYHTGSQGETTIDFMNKATIKLHISAKDYFTKNITLKYKPHITITLVKKNVTLSPIMIKSTIPHINQPSEYTLNERNINNLPIQLFTVDDILTQASMINIIRPQGIYSHAPIIIINGMSNVPSRTLILYDGIRLNKADDGNTNWNMLPPEAISQVNIGLSSQSTSWGAGAMGGAINFIRTRPAPGTHVQATMQYGSYQTKGVMARTSFFNPQKNKSFMDIIISADQSNGYVSVPDTLQLPDVEYIPTSMQEARLNLVYGHSFKNNSTIKFYLNAFTDSRSMGIKIRKDNIVKHPTLLVATKYTRKIGHFTLQANIHAINEHYFKVIEKLKHNDYSLIYVYSNRNDAGLDIFITGPLTPRLSLNTGLSNTWGKVVGRDQYMTSPDIVINSGQIIALDYFIDLAYYALKNKNLIVNTGGEMNLTNIIDPAFVILNPTPETDFLQPYTGVSTGSWLHNYSGKLAVSYKFSQNTFTIGANSGYTLPTLDDLTRSGFMRLGFKLANPHLKPEHTIDLFSSFARKSNLLDIQVNLHHKIGYDFMYYVETGDYLFGGRKPIIQKQNVTQAIIDMVNLNASFSPFGFITLNSSYTFTNAYITSFEQAPQYTGNKITYTPEHSVVLGLQFRSRMATVSLDYRYMDQMFTDVANTKIIPAHYTIDGKITIPVNKNLSLQLSVDNLTGQQYLVYSDQLSLGRFWLVKLVYKK